VEAIRGVAVPDYLPGQRDPRLIAATASHILKIIRANERPDPNTVFAWRAEALVALAGALPD